jgi:hypothetical protein
MRVREYRSFASIEMVIPRVLEGPEWNNKLEIAAKSSICSSLNVLTTLFTGRSSKERRTW